MKTQTIGIYGGSFSPPHNGHFHAVEAFLSQEHPDRMLVIPTFTPPHKQLDGDASAEDRYQMCRLAFSSLPVTVSDREIRRGGKSYTVLTLRELKAENTRLVFLCGTDMFLTLDSWYCAADIFALAEIVYVCRESGEDAVATRAEMQEVADRYRREFSAKVRELRCDAVDISSTRLREAIADGREATRYLHPDVWEYIKKCHLYQK